MFDNTQESFQNLRKIMLEGTSPVYFWFGAGLSIDAGMPSWSQLRKNLILRGRKWLEPQKELADIDSRRAKLDVAEHEPDSWNAFERIYEALGENEYRKEIASEFAQAVRCKIPFVYECLMGVKNIRGVITTNIDRLTTRAFVNINNGALPVEFSGYQCGSHNYVLQGTRFFVLNLHGTVEDYASWVMRKTDREKLFSNIGYNALLKGLFASGVVVFIGANPMDEAIRCHLEKVRRGDFIPGTSSMYWITDNTKSDAFEFSDRYNFSRIIYSSRDNHRELKDVVTQLCCGKSYEEEDATPAVINLPNINKSVRNFEKIDFSNLSEEDVREYLNKRAYEILKSGTQSGYDAYKAFLHEYRKQIHQAWFVDKGERLLGLTLKEEIGEGTFGRVYRAVDSAGEEFAVKVLKEDVMRKAEYLQSFRRGVRAMRILSEKNIKGIVKFRSATEIPASVVMELINGENLHEIVLQHQLSTWKEKMSVLKEVGRIIRDAHALPERVLHRDIRPHNIMVRNFYGEGCSDICVLDFDLAFHKDANEVSVPMGVGNGYTAPEQTKSFGQKGESRSSRVDSYGFAMLCYFVITGKDPVPQQCMMQGWEETVNHDVGGRRCSEWYSLPFKMAEIIKTCTRPDQNERWDLYQIYGYIDALNRVLTNPIFNVMPDLILEEILYRIAVSKKCQTSIITSLDGYKTLTIPSGTCYRFGLRNSVVLVEVLWKDDGTQEFKRCKKILFDRTNALVNKMRKQGFDKVEVSYDGNSVRIEISFETVNFSIDNLIKFVNVLSNYDVSPNN